MWELELIPIGTGPTVSCPIRLHNLVTGKCKQFALEGKGWPFLISVVLAIRKRTGDFNLLMRVPPGNGEVLCRVMWDTHELLGD